MVLKIKEWPSKLLQTPSGRRLACAYSSSASSERGQGSEARVSVTSALKVASERQEWLERPSKVSVSLRKVQRGAPGWDGCYYQGSPDPLAGLG